MAPTHFYRNLNFHRISLLILLVCSVSLVVLPISSSTKLPDGVELPEEPGIYLARESEGRRQLTQLEPSISMQSFLGEKRNSPNNDAVVNVVQGDLTASFVGADNGQAFIYDENTGTRLHLKTSMPVFKAFGVSTSRQRLLYSPLKDRIPSGELFLEELATGTATRITADLILEAAFSPDELEIAYTFATGEGFGLATVNVESKEGEKLISANVLPDFLQWDSSGTEIYFFETTNEINTIGIIPHKISVTNKKPIIVAQDELPSHFPKLSPESAYLDTSSREISSTHSEIHYPFEVNSPDNTKRVCGGNLFGNSFIQLCENFNVLNQSYLTEGLLLKVTNQGIIVRTFEENRTATDFVDWSGNKSRLALSPQVSYNLPMSKTSPNNGSFVVTRSGTGYGSNQCTIVGSYHEGSVQFAFDMQKGGTSIPGQHVIASGEGLAINPVENINCNSCDSEVGGCGGMPHCSTSQANGGWGNSVVIQHADTTWSRYAHMQFNSVPIQHGDSVCQGLYIGNQGGTGTSCGSFNGCGDHLHFQKQASATGSSISASFSDVPSNPLSCINYQTGSTEVSSCSTCQSGAATLPNRDGGPPIHPPGSVIKTASNSTVYLIDPDNRKRPITSASVLAQLYNQSTDARTSTNFSNWVITVGQSELDLYEQGGNISAAQPGNGKPFPDGKLIGFNGEVSIVTGVGKRRPFVSASTFTGLGFNFCQVVNVSQSEYNSYPEGPPVDAMLLLTSSVNLTPAGPYTVGQNISGTFTAKNVGYASIPLSSLGIGGRLNGSPYDLSFVSTTLAAGSSHPFGSQARQLTSAGTYDFFAAYQESNGHWAISVPAAPGVIRIRQITVTNTTTPPAPTANAATNVTGSSFTANWSNSSGATGYRLDVSFTSNFSSYVSGYQNLDVGNTSSRSVSGLTTGINYYYRVRAYNSASTPSGNSNTINVTTADNPPTAPIANAATNVISSSFTANWSSSSGATGYRLDVSTSNSFGSFVSGYQNSDVGNVVSRSVTGLSAATTYFYRVRAYNGGGTSGNSNTSSLTTAGSPPPTRILTVASSNPSSGVSITISPNDNNGQSNGVTPFTRVYNNNTNMALTAPATAGGNNFQKWQLDGVDLTTSLLANFVMDANHTVTALYTPPSDNTGPNLNITSHSNGQTVTINTITISGTATDSGRGNNGISSVTVNGVRASNDTATGSGTTNWSRPITLNQGANDITVAARDNSPNQNPTMQSITVNYQPQSSGPANDNFANSQFISGGSGSINGSNVGATKESGEPNHGDNSGGASVWYFWSAPGNGSATFTTAGSNFDTLLGVYTNSSVSNLNTIAGSDDVGGGDLTSSVTFNTVAGTVYRIAVDGYDGATGNINLNWGFSINPTLSTLHFSVSSYSVNESNARATITVTRTGDAFGVATIGYSTVDDPAAVRCDTVNGVAYARCDYATTIDTLRFEAGQAEKTFTVPILDDAHVEGPETVTLRLGGVSGAMLGTQGTATLTITDNDTGGLPNPIFGSPFFVRMQYLDFLSREPEPNEPWSTILNNCPNPFNSAFDHTNPSAACDRIIVSQSFFGSPEFRLKGFYAFTFYRVAFNRRPTYEEIIPDMRSVSGATADEVYQKRAALPVNFTNRPEFKGLYDALGNTAFVNTLLDRYGLQAITSPDPANPEGGTKVILTRADLINRLGTSGAQLLTRAQVLRAVVESNEVGAVEYNPAFVAMQYYGYLRRTPEEEGYQAWLRVINQDPNNIRIMVNGFMNSTEYRLRFGTP